MPRQLTILVTEDNATLRDIVARYLVRQGYHVRTARNGKVALDILATEEVHLLLLDLRMPEIDGFAVLRQLGEKRRGRLPYVIVMSASAAEADRGKIEELRGDDYLPKPFLLSHLFERVLEIEHSLRRGEWPRPSF